MNGGIAACDTSRRQHHTRLPFPVKRRLLLAAVFLLAGAVVNVAVAWGWVLVVVILW